MLTCKCLTCPYHCYVGQQVLPNSLQVGRLCYTGRTQRTTVLYRKSEREVYFIIQLHGRACDVRFSKVLQTIQFSLALLPVGQNRKTGGSPRNRYISLVTVTWAWANEEKASLSAWHMEWSMSSNRMANAWQPRSDTWRERARRGCAWERVSNHAKLHSCSIYYLIVSYTCLSLRLSSVRSQAEEKTMSWPGERA